MSVLLGHRQSRSQYQDRSRRVGPARGGSEQAGRSGRLRPHL